jgi:glycosyltransferase involved in cell wall biosynthesis
VKLLHTESSLGWGGQEMRIVKEAYLTQLKRQSFDVAIVCCPQSQFIQRAEHDVRLLPVDISRKSIRCLLSLISLFRTEQPDLVVTHSSTDSWLTVVARFFVKRKFRIIRVRHVSAPISDGVATRFLYGQAESVVTTSSEIRKHVIEKTGLSSNRVFSIPTGVDPIVFAHDLSQAETGLDDVSPPPEPQLKVALMVATLRSWKGHRYLFEALSELGGWEVWIVGDGPQLESLQGLVSNLSLDERVTFFGHRKDVRNFMSQADVFVQPSYANEGVSQSVLQAMSMEMLVVVGDISGLNEVVRDKENGILVTPKSVGSLIEAFRWIEAHEEKLSTLQREARGTVQNDYSEDTMIESMLQLFETSAS